MSDAPVEVAVGVLIRPDGSFLIAQRPEGKPMAGYWEFPGGKLEPGESVFDALKREFIEELGVEITEVYPWAQRIFVYPHATVRLHYCRVYAWSGEPQSLEGQAWCWESIDAPRVDPWLPGALPLRRWLDLPEEYAISNASVGSAEDGISSFLARLDRRLAQGDLRMLQLREPAMSPAQFATLFDQVRGRCKEHRVRLLVNSRHREFAENADGLHLTSADLRACTVRPDHSWCAASCHDAGEIARAGALGLDFAVLGPVQTTATHAGMPGIGWQAFEKALAATELPVYAVGGMGRSDRLLARRHGAHGIAMIRAAWAAPGASD